MIRYANTILLLFAMLLVPEDQACAECNCDEALPRCFLLLPLLSCSTTPTQCPIVSICPMHSHHTPPPSSFPLCLPCDLPQPLLMPSYVAAMLLVPQDRACAECNSGAALLRCFLLLPALCCSAAPTQCPIVSTFPMHSHHTSLSSSFPLPHAHDTTGSSRPAPHPGTKP